MRLLLQYYLYYVWLSLLPSEYSSMILGYFVKHQNWWERPKKIVLQAVKLKYWEVKCGARKIFRAFQTTQIVIKCISPTLDIVQTNMSHYLHFRCFLFSFDWSIYFVFFTITERTERSFLTSQIEQAAQRKPAQLPVEFTWPGSVQSWYALLYQPHIKITLFFVMIHFHTHLLSWT